MSDTKLTTYFGQFNLQRLPHRKKETLRAWDSADVQILELLAEDSSKLSGGVLLVNDIFACLSVHLNQYNPSSWSDSWISHEALRQNFNLNGLHEISYMTIDSLHLPKKVMSVVVFKVPKSMALFEYQLLRIKPLITKDTQFIVAGMIKYMPKKVWLLLESIIGSTQTHRAVKKSKLIEVNVSDDLEDVSNPYPLKWSLEGTELELLNHANVFAREHLDVGTRFFLENLPTFDSNKKIIDLGCGNGVIGVSIANTLNSSDILFVDESYMAIESTKQNVIQLKGEHSFKFHCGNGLLKVKKQSADIILCNPPFHQHHSNGETMALTMFSQASRVLNKDGELWIVGNRHLAYHTKLTTWFLNVVLIASNKNFVVLKASNPKTFNNEKAY